MRILIVCFSVHFVGLLEELSCNKVCYYYIYLKFLLWGKFTPSLWVSATTVLVFCGDEKAQSELLRIRGHKVNADDSFELGVVELRGQ